MSEILSLEKLYKEIMELRREIKLIKQNVIEEEFMTPEEEELLEIAIEEHKKGKTKRLEDLKKELGE
jgi:hypothetical protein